MADLVKKIKIKKQDGTFTDYIPIGANAENVVFSDNNSLEEDFKSNELYINSGSIVQINKKCSYIKSLKIEGDTYQDGTPAYNNPEKVVTLTGDVEMIINGQEHILPFKDLELCRYGNVSDTLEKIDGVWYKNEKIGIVVFDGIESYNRTYGLAKGGERNNYCFRCGGCVNDMRRVSYDYEAYCDYFEPANCYGNDVQGFFIHYPSADSTSAVYFSFPSSVMGNVTDFKNWLSENRPKVYYKLATSRLKQITNSDLLKALDNILSIDFNNNINVSLSLENSLTPLLEIQAYPNIIKASIEKSKENNISSIDAIDYVKGLSEEYDYYDEITYEKKRYNDETDYYVITVPKKDKYGKQIDLYVGDGGKGQDTPIQYAQKNHTTLTINASLPLTNTVTGQSRQPNVISNGVVVAGQNLIEEGVPYNYMYLGVKADRTLADYQVNETTAKQMLDDGCLNVWNVYYKLIENGQKLDLTNVICNEPTVVTDPNPRQAIGLLEDGTMLIVSCDARTDIDIGLTSDQLQDVMLELGCIEAWNLDGGGSTSTVIKGSKLNKNIDTNGTKDRRIRFTLNAKKEIKNIGIAQAFSKIGEEKQNIIQQIIPYINQVKNDGFKFTKLHNKDLNTITDFVIGFGNNLTGTPYPAVTSGYLICLPHVDAEWKGKYCTQLFFNRDTYRCFQRRLVNEVWTDWISIYNKECFLGRWGSLTKATDGVEYITWANNTAATDTGQFIKNSEDATELIFQDNFGNVPNTRTRGMVFAYLNVTIPSSAYDNVDSITLKVKWQKRETDTWGEGTWNQITLLKGQTNYYITQPWLINMANGEGIRFTIEAPAGCQFSLNASGHLTRAYY